MRVIVSAPTRAGQDAEDTWRTNDVQFDYAFWQRYLGCYEAVTVVVRAESVEKPKGSGRVQMNGPGVDVLVVPDFGLRSLDARSIHRSRLMARGLLAEKAAIIVRGPCPVGYLIAYLARRRRRPFGLELTSEPLEVGREVGGKAKGITSRLLASQTAMACEAASDVCYVANYLAEHYPTSGRQHFYSSVCLSADQIALEPRNVGQFMCINLRLAFVGSLEQRYKGLMDALQALAMLWKRGLKPTLTVVGEGRHRTSAEEWVRSAGLSASVKFLGHQPRRAVLDVFDASDLFILSSHTEGLPRALIEAMARGLPCIATSVGGVPELLDARWLVPVRNPKALACKIEWAWRQPRLLAEASNRNIVVAARYRDELLRERREAAYWSIREATNRWIHGGPEPSY